MSGEAPKDVTDAYRFWDDLVRTNFQLALAPKGDGPEALRAARERFQRGWQRALEERDEALVRMIACLEKADRAVR